MLVLNYAPLQYTIYMKVVLVANNIRSTHNVGALLRTADCLGCDSVYLTGYTPYPRTDNDQRLPYIADKIHRKIQKTALGAEENLAWQYKENIGSVIDKLRHDGFEIFALEQTKTAIDILSFNPPQNVCMIVGNEVDGVDATVINQCDHVLEIPMRGSKESLNVVQAAAIGLYHCMLTVKA